MNNKINYEEIHEKAYIESEEYLKNNGYFFDDTYTDQDLEMFENLIWKAGKDYQDGTLSSSAFNIICSDFQGNPVYYSLSSYARTLISNGLELDYYMYIAPNEKELLEINNNIKKLLIWRFQSQ